LPTTILRRSRVPRPGWALGMAAERSVGRVLLHDDRSDDHDDCALIACSGIARPGGRSLEPARKNARNLLSLPRSTVLRFDRFRIDAGNVCLEDDSGPLHLNRKAFEVLCVLIERRGRLVSKDELLDAIWPDTHVADGVLKVCMAEIRAALGDSRTKPRFIETV